MARGQEEAFLLCILEFGTREGINELLLIVEASYNRILVLEQIFATYVAKDKSRSMIYLIKIRQLAHFPSPESQIVII